MAESGMGRHNFDIDILKETLCAQQQLLQKLYNELEAEREASSSAASEALSMILRLQGEKAAVQMEAEQYKRLAEEKMGYAEESLAIFEDIMYQKDMEMAALDSQVQAYRYKLLSMGCEDPGIGETTSPENLLQRNESFVGETNLKRIGRRNSAPLLTLISCMRKGVTERESCLSPKTDLVHKTVEDCTAQDMNESSSDWEKKTDNSNMGDINSYLEQIRKLDGRVKEIAGVSYANLQSSTRSPSPLSQSSGNPYDLTREPTAYDMDKVKHPGNVKESEITTECPCSPGVLDVFEVPQVEESYDDCQLKRNNQKKMVLQDENKVEKPDAVSEEIVKPYIQEQESDWLQKVLKSSQQQKTFCKPSSAIEVDCNFATVHPIGKVSISQPLLQQFNQTSEIVEIDRQAGRLVSADREEERKLLKEIREKLNSIECEIRSWKVKESSHRDEVPIATLAEVIFFNLFSLCLHYCS
ncbi:uncharacterized protein [Coffea arabica]|uniref:Uncharacterized protein isoform X1 n=1 Tax=Coffea arabica TaxID=13443 RepID=A0A6P6SWQ0_COFAR|nr:uncharacterized protein LOC113695567 isoform X1 [Coffea arabica]